MKILIEREKKEIEIEFVGTCLDLLNKLEINPETVLIISNGELLQDEDLVKNSDSIKIVSVVSGG